MSAPTAIRRRLLITGIVQGVGFRPFVHRLARAHALSGFVQNTSAGVVIEAQGPSDAIDAFIDTLRHRPPPLARIGQCSSAEVPLAAGTTFDIIASTHGNGRSWLPPDVGLCEACRHELHDPSDRRWRHAFITCTDCGPRYTIIRDLPYDRPTTTMAPFDLCARCRAEYVAPDGRRFHAEPVACHDCGPRLWLEERGDDGVVRRNEADALARALEIIAGGGTVAVKGVGGFHLICDAENAGAVNTLRRRKQRPHQPFAVVVADAGRAAAIGAPSTNAARALESPARPIVLIDLLPSSGLANEVHPNLRQVGVMLPHSPLHELLVSDWSRLRGPDRSAALVMTSANRTEEPVVIDDDDARAGLADLSDALLLHDRRILMRCDDSVLADNGDEPPVPIRRSRGESPAPLPLPFAGAPLLAVGGELKATFCLAFDGQAILSPHVGDMEHVDTLDAFSAAVDHFCRVFRVEPELYVCDAHPGYLSARWAAETGGTVVSVQHHHAHAASLMAEHRLGVDDDLLTFCFDGTGYGPDGAVWGGEVLAARYTDATRLAHLDYAPLPGGDAGVRDVARLALTYMERAGVRWHDGLAPVRACSADAQRLLAQQLARQVHVVNTSSMGRLFDVVSAIAGVCQRSTYEGQAAMELEAAADDQTSVGLVYRFEWSLEADGLRRIRWQPVVAAVAEDAAAGQTPGRISAAFHEAVANLVGELADALLTSTSQRRVGVTGGVFQNRRLLRLTARVLAQRGIALLTHRVVPPNDGGLSLGQAAISAARCRRSDWS